MIDSPAALGRALAALGYRHVSCRQVTTIGIQCLRADGRGWSFANDTSRPPVFNFQPAGQPGGFSCTPQVMFSRLGCPSTQPLAVISYTAIN
jgi:hypothetical protein